MELKARVQAGLKDAMKAQDAARLSTLRLINAAIKDRAIAKRGAEDEEGITDDDVLQILSRMVKQRQESARAYEEGGRLELAEKERTEIDVIETYLPRPMSEEEVDTAVGAAIERTEASSIRDMGRVMGDLKARHQGRMDFAAVAPKVKARLT